MKVCLVNTSECKGGAAIACNRLMKALQKNGIEACTIVRDKQTQDSHVISINTSWLKKKVNFLRFIWERLVIWIANGFSRQNLFSVSLANTGTDISKLPELQQADIIHLHWVNQGFLSLQDIRKIISLGKPVVWTMHDMWPCTGICHHARECVRYQIGCGECPFLKFPGHHDLSVSGFRKKMSSEFDKVTYVGCSQWIKAKAKGSCILKKSKILSIPNPINTCVFSPLDKELACKQFKLSPGKYFILFGAPRINDPRKGYQYYFEALELLAQKYPELQDRIELVFLGNEGLQMPPSIPYKVNLVGYLSDENSISALYNAVDVFVTPSLEENLPNTIMESMACMTPVVGFEVGGIPEMIDHLQNGYIAKYKDSLDLMAGIYWILFEADRKQMKKHCREKIEKCYAETIVGQQYLSLYLQLLRK